MKNYLICFCLALPTVALLHAQGPLTPPGPPGQTMKRLDQIEPRTPIAAAPYTISLSGSYYLTGNLTVSSGTAITIVANGVTLDLNGFTISSTAASAVGYGVLLDNRLRDISISNGHIRGGVTYNSGTGLFTGAGFAGGISDSATFPATNVLISRISVSGCLLDGINLSAEDHSTVVEFCAVDTAGGSGIYANTVTASSSRFCGVCGIAGFQVSNSSGQAFFGDGIFATGPAENCYGIGTGSGYGIGAAVATGCHGVANGSGVGVHATGSATNCYGTSASGDGVVAGAATGCYGNSDGNGRGVGAGTASYCNGSSVLGRGLNADVATGCKGASLNFSSTEDGVNVYQSATGCHGVANGSGVGVRATGSATNCYGLSNFGDGLLTEGATGCRGASISGRGIFANYTAMNCHGFSSSGRGLFTSVATNCFGQTTTGDFGLVAHLANTCRGWQIDGVGIALGADIAIGCNSAGGTISSPSKHLGTP